MKKKMIIIMCTASLIMPVLGFAEKGKGPNPSPTAYEHAADKARFKRGEAVFNKKAHKKARAEKRAKKKAAKEKKKMEEARDKGEGQVKVKF